MVKANGTKPGPADFHEDSYGQLVVSAQAQGKLDIHGMVRTTDHSLSSKGRDQAGE